MQDSSCRLLLSHARCEMTSARISSVSSSIRVGARMCSTAFYVFCAMWDHVHFVQPAAGHHHSTLYDR